MKNITSVLYIFFSFLLIGCADAQEQNNTLEATAFNEKIKATPDAVVLDVRTPQEFAKGHLLNAINYNWNDKNFQSQVASLDKSKPLFVYCLSGGRSAKAAESLRSQGFKSVYELNGGIMKWRSAKLPEEKNTPSSVGELTTAQYNELIASNHLVLVDFYAEWCEPCKKMEPYLNEIAAEMKGKVKVIRLNVDVHQKLTKELGIEELPVLHLYKNKKQVWSNKGYIGKEEVLKILNNEFSI